MVGKRAGRGRRGEGRGKTAAGISLALHLTIGSIAGVLLHGPNAQIAEAGSGEPGAIDVGIEEAVPLPDPTAVTSAGESAKLELSTDAAGATAVSRKSAVTPSPRSRARAHLATTNEAPPAAPAVTTTGTTPIVAASAPSEARPEIASGGSATPAPPQAATSALTASAPPAPRAPAPTEPARPPRTTPIFLPPEVATYLRTQDEFPALPASLRHQGAHYQQKLEICVAADGRVTNVGFESAAAPALNSALQAAVRGWRYHPFLVDGVATPFCHRMIVSYELG